VPAELELRDWNLHNRKSDVLASVVDEGPQDKQVRNHQQSCVHWLKLLTVVEMAKHTPPKVK
jgi:hypothetical protein